MEMLARTWTSASAGAVAAAVLVAACGGGDGRPDWCSPETDVCLSDTAILTYETIDVIAREESWAGETVRACDYRIDGDFPDPLDDPSRTDDVCDVAAAAGAALNDFELQGDDNGEVRFQLEPLPSDDHPLGTREAGIYRLVIEGPGSGPGRSTNLHGILFGVVNLGE